jgi:ribonuclease G
MTRQNVTEGVREIMTKTCPICDGEGVIKSEETVAIAVDRHLRELVRNAGKDVAEAYLVRLNPKVTAQFIGENARMLHALEADTGRFFSFEGSEGLPLDHFAISLEGTREQVLAAAVPFSDGDEVHVHIVEPHMYEVDDAVAKIDGYIISVQGAGPFVGQKRLVRIEEAGRTAATAVLIDLTDEERERIEADREAEAKRRRRGRRGGRARRKDDNGASAADEAPVDEAPSPGAGVADVRASTGPGDALEAEVDGGVVPAAVVAPPIDEEKPKRRRTTRRKAAPAEETEASGDGGGEADATATAVETPPAEEAEDKPKRGRTRRRKAAEPEEEPAEAASADPAPAEEVPAEEAAAEDGDEDADDDALDLKPRRRGRRGGRRRSRAKAEADAEVTETEQS